MWDDLSIKPKQWLYNKAGVGKIKHEGVANKYKVTWLHTHNYCCFTSVRVPYVTRNKNYAGIGLYTVNT